MSPPGRAITRAFVVGLALLLAAGIAGRGTSEGGDEPPVFTAGVELVRIDVVVLDSAGRPVTGLEAADFTIEENGRTQAVTSFEPVVVRRGEPITEAAAPPEPEAVSANRARGARDGRCLFLFLDTGHLTHASAEYLRQALRRYLDSELRDGDWVTIVAPEQELWWTARTPWEYRQLRRVIEAVQGRHPGDPLRDPMPDWFDVCKREYGTDYPPCRIGMAGPGGGPSEPGPVRDASGPAPPIGRNDMPGERFTAINDPATEVREAEITRKGLQQAIESMQETSGRKSLVLVAESFVLLPQMKGYRELIDAARRAHVTVDFLDPRRLSTGWTAERRTLVPPSPSEPPRAYLAEGSGDLVDVTGGRSLAGNDPSEALRRLVAESEAYYLLGYVPADGRAGERRVRVRVRQPGLEVRARSRYAVAAAAATGTTGSVAVAGDERLRMAMRRLSDTTDLPLVISTFFFDEDEKGEVATLLAAELPAQDAPASRRFRVATEMRRADGGPPVRDRFEATVEARPHEPILLTRPWRMKPGVRQVRVLVEDVASGRIATAVHTFEVPGLSPLRLSTPIVTNVLAGEANAPRLMLGRDFPSEGRLYCQFTVYGARGGDGSEARVSSSWELRRTNESVQAEARQPIVARRGSHLVRTIVLALDRLEPGDYELLLLVEDEQSRTSVRRYERFRVL